MTEVTKNTRYLEDGFRRGLIDEIQFWQELIIESGLREHSPEFERAQYALQLARFKLSELQNYKISISESTQSLAHH